MARGLSCTCGGRTLNDAIPGCPVCCAKALRSSGSSFAPKRWFLGQGILSKPLSYKTFLDEIVASMASLGRVTVFNNRSCFGGQSLRRGGAQALAAAGWSLSLIRKWGRWAPDSKVVERYVQNAELWSADVNAADAILGSMNNVPTHVYQ